MTNRLFLFLSLSLLVFLSFGLSPAAHAGEVYDGLRHLYPNAEFFKDYEVRDEVITKWDAAKLGPQPNPAQITIAAADAAAAREAARTARQQELDLLESARAKLARNEDLPAAELRAVLRALIRRSATTPTSAGAAATSR